MEKRLYTPILFLVFNRPEKTLQTFNAIREVRPTKLYVAIDAPRENRPDDVENWRKVKEIVHNVDWDCETHYLIREKNLGCTLSGKTAWAQVLSFLILSMISVFIIIFILKPKIQSNEQ